jgi:Co/Zn/Cd efflux system component
MRPHFKLACLLLIFSLAELRVTDLVLTNAALELGAEEANPLVSYVLASYGHHKGQMIVIVTSALFLLGLVAVTIWAPDERFIAQVLLCVSALIVIFSLTVLSNSIQVAQHALHFVGG